MNDLGFILTRNAVHLLFKKKDMEHYAYNESVSKQYAESSISFINAEWLKFGSPNIDHISISGIPLGLTATRVISSIFIGFSLAFPSTIISIQDIFDALLLTQAANTVSVVNFENGFYGIKIKNSDKVVKIKEEYLVQLKENNNEYLFVSNSKIDTIDDVIVLEPLQILRSMLDVDFKYRKKSKLKNFLSDRIY